MTTLIQSYEKQYGGITSEITGNLGRIARSDDGERPKLLHDTSQLFDEARDILEQMSLEIQELAYDQRTKYSNRIDFYAKELDRLSTEFKRPKYSNRKTPSAAGQKDPLMADEDSLREEVLYDSDIRATLLNNTERAVRGSGRLDDGVKIALQTEEVGGQILTDLGDQRSKLQRSRNRLRQVDSDLNKSSRILSEMTRRIIQNRVLLGGIIFLIIIVFIVAIYLATHGESHAPIGKSPTHPVNTDTSALKNSGVASPHT